MLSPAPLLLLFIVVTEFAHGAFLGAQLPAPGGITPIHSIGMLWAIGWWLQKDRHGRGVLSVYDVGLFLYLAWPIVISYYLLKTRGAKGLLIILGFAVAYVAAALLGALLSVVVLAMRS
ncbi:MAG TPA: hypothetical protein VE863_20290 [Pyrinomonadaceae bacterium]|jgi:hypothetical protein|nr:hypothetical protein [Pyrinomonadaceae bacterium]